MVGNTSGQDGKNSSAYSENPAISNRKEATMDEAGDIRAYVGEGVTFTGTIRYQGTVKIDGNLEGEVHTDGVLLVGEKAVISAKIQSGTITCRGRIVGDISAKEKVKLMAPAVFEGTIKSPAISMEEGVLFNGTCEMPSKGDGTKKPEAEFKKPVLETKKPEAEVKKARIRNSPFFGKNDEGSITI